jgi:hypothetical protein
MENGFAVKPSHKKFSPFFTRGGEEVFFILHSPISENGPSAIQGERAMSPFSILWEWEERGVTTPNITSKSDFQVKLRPNPWWKRKKR